MDTDATHRRRRKAERPQELLDAALELFVEKGFAATRAEEVALRAGVSKGTLYLYYPSKEDLLKAVVSQRLSARIADALERAARHRGSCAELLRTELVRWWIEVVNSPLSGVFKLVITEVRNFPEIADTYVREVVEPAQALVAGIIERGIASGEFRQLDVHAAVHSLTLPMVMLCLHCHSLGVCTQMNPPLEPDHFVRQHVELMLLGLEARA